MAPATALADGTYTAVASQSDGAANIGSSTARTFTVDTTVPTVASIVGADPTPTNAASMHSTVTFSESVTGVDASDFALATTGVSGAAIIGVSGSGVTYTVIVNTGTGNGTIGLNLVDDDSISDAAGNKLGGTGAGNGNFTGQTYSTPATVSTSTTVSSSQNPSVSGQSVTFTATVTPASGSTNPTGSVTFTDTTTNVTLCSSVGVSNGSGNTSTATCATWRSR